MNNIGMAINTVVASMNEWLADFNRGENNCNRRDGINDREWSYIRVYCAAEVSEMCDIYELPDDITHGIMVGIEMMNVTDGTSSIYGYISWAKYIDGVMVVEDTDEVLADGPSLSGATVDEATEWINRYCNKCCIEVVAPVDIASVDLV